MTDLRETVPGCFKLAPPGRVGRARPFLKDSNYLLLAGSCQDDAFVLRYLQRRVIFAEWLCATAGLGMQSRPGDSVSHQPGDNGGGTCRGDFQIARGSSVCRDLVALDGDG